MDCHPSALQNDLFGHTAVLQHYHASAHIQQKEIGNGSSSLSSQVDHILLIDLQTSLLSAAA